MVQRGEGTTVTITTQWKDYYDISRFTQDNKGKLYNIDGSTMGSGGFLPSFIDTA